MPWTEVSHGRFERTLDPSEAFFTRLGALPHPPGRERWGLTSVSQFKTDLPPDEILQALRQAWKDLRYQFPVLAASLEESSKVYEVPTDAALETWLEKTIVVEADNADPDEIIGTYKSTPHARLHYLPGSSQILIRTSHWRTDGVGLCMLTNGFFNALANPREIAFGDEGKRLSPSMEEAAGICEVTEEKMQTVREKWAEGLQGGRSVAIPIKGLAVSRGTYRKTHVFSEKTTSAVVAACKKRGVSVTTAITAALTLTVRQHEEGEPDQRGKRMSFLPYFNVRSYMPETFKSVEHPLSVMVLGAPINIELLDFEESIKQIAPFYSRDLSPSSGSDFIPLIGAWNQFHIDLLTTPPPKPADSAAQAPPQTPLPIPATTPSLNSMGILDRYIKPEHQGKYHFEITEFWFAVEILGPIILCYAWTFRGKLRLTPYYNEAFFDGDYVQKILDSLSKTLLEKLEVIE